MATKHAVLSASSSERWLNCPPSARLCEAYEDKGSDYAAEGTDAHALCEFRLKQTLGIPANDPIENLTWYNEEMEDCAAVGKALEGTICKNLFLCNRQQTAFYLLTMPGDKPFHTKDLSAKLGCARLSFGPPEDMERLLGVTPGSATVLALQNDTAGEVALVIDRAVLQAPRFGCHPCINTSSLAFSTQDLTEKLLPALGHAPVLVDLPEDSDA